MADIIPSGPNTTTGRNSKLANGDGLTDPAGSFIAGGTGAFGVTGLANGATGVVSAIIGVTGVALAGVTGLRGITGILGLTGVEGLQGVTGLRGITGLGAIGATGLLGETGLQGATGIIGSQGLTGFQGVTGFFGDTGMQGVTGLFGVTGFAPDGVTGLVGPTGLLGVTGFVGATGGLMLGLTGLQGVTGLQGATGLLDLITLDVQRQTSGVTLAYILPANALGTDNQHLEIWASGLSATSGDATTIILQLGGYNLLNTSVTAPGGTNISIHGILIRVGASLQEGTFQAVYGTGAGTTDWQSITADLTTSQNIIASLTSVGTGHILYSLLVRRLKQPG